MNLGLLSTGAVPVRNVWRKYRCFRLEEFTAPSSSEIQAEFTERVREALEVDSITPVFKQLTADAWLCTFFHQASRDHRTPTYENGKPGLITYRPREAATFVFDPEHRLFYLSTRRIKHLPALLRILQGFLLPTDENGALPAEVLFDLERLRLLPESVRHPQPGEAPWTRLQLRNLFCASPGLEGVVQDYRSPSNLFDTPHFFADRQEDFFLNSTFAVEIPERRRPLSVQVFNLNACIRATLTTDSLEATASLVSLLSA